MRGVLIVEDEKELREMLKISLAPGADAIYSKPFSINVLISKIEQLLTDEQPA